MPADPLPPGRGPDGQRPAVPPPPGNGDIRYQMFAPVCTVPLHLVHLRLPQHLPPRQHPHQVRGRQLRRGAPVHAVVGVLEGGKYVSTANTLCCSTLAARAGLAPASSSRDAVSARSALAASISAVMPPVSPSVSSVCG